MNLRGAISAKLLDFGSWADEMDDMPLPGK